MVIHYIILSSSYSTRSRIALHRPYHGRIDYSEVGPIVSRIEGCFGGATVQMGVHIMQTRSDDWESVTEEDPYFKGVRVIDSVDEFIRLIKMDEFLRGVDVAKYILKTVPCTHTRVNKLTYMCYADYLCSTGRRMFTDDIYAFTYGPVVETVWDSLKEFGHSGRVIAYNEELDDSTQMDISPSRMSIRSRILFAANGAEILHSIDATLRRFEDFPTGELVDLTHREMTPWSLTDRSYKFSRISDDLILDYHRNELPWFTGQ
ncbi:Panacea domain-containing protein [Candidatus Methanoprimaticola sp. MG2]|uniref:Panacea domain-containing protein n=1 Tax=Candidatus Methanoprimaticola sp. MG2 TaxID=3228838 RepID=UPI0039C66E39